MTSTAAPYVQVLTVEVTTADIRQHNGERALLHAIQRISGAQEACIAKGYVGFIDQNDRLWAAHLWADALVYCHNVKCARVPRPIKPVKVCFRRVAEWPPGGFK